MRLFSKSRKRALRGGVILAAAVLTAAACSSGSGGTGSSTAHNSSTPHQGGSLTALEPSGYSGDWPAGLDPVSNTNGAADQSQMDAIYGQWFQLGAKGKIIPDLATGYSHSNGAKTWTINFRHGVTFTDGTPLNASAVVWNIRRDLKSTCTCKPTWLSTSLSSVTDPGPYTVQITLKQPDGAFIDQIFDSNVDWIASPTAVKKMGAKKFAQYPVGAGPFEVVSDTISSELVLKRNPHYWQKGHPYLDQLTFKTVSGDEAAYEAMLAGEGQVYEDMGTPSLLPQIRQHFTAINQPGTTAYDLQLNTLAPPFSNKQARLAIYYATNFTPILQHVFDGDGTPTESFTGPGGICYEPAVPGYPGYNLAMAKQIVKQLGGLTVSMGTLSSPVNNEAMEALQTEWAKAGIKTTIHSYSLASLIQEFTSKKWQAMIQTAGAYDPAGGVGVGFRFLSTSVFSGVQDPHLDSLLNQATATVNQSQRCKLYHQAAAYIAQQAYGPFYFTLSPVDVAAKNVHGPGLTSPLPTVAVVPAIPWADVWMS
jgi:peptide/nickel transport system substrate-binding protein